jgi:hypothetical protein
MVPHMRPGRPYQAWPGWGRLPDQLPVVEQRAATSMLPAMLDTPKTAFTITALCPPPRCGAARRHVNAPGNAGHAENGVHNHGIVPASAQH